MSIIFKAVAIGAIAVMGMSSRVAAQPSTDDLGIPPEIIEDSPVLQRWLQEVPNVLESIRQDPGFRTRLRLGFATFSSDENTTDIYLGVEDFFISRTGLTISADYQASFNGEGESVGANLHYYLFPLGKYVNFAPLVGYRYVETGNYSTDGVNLGARLIFVLSRTGAADLTLTQSFVSPGSRDEVGITNISVGFAFTRHFRLATDFQQQNSRGDNERRVGIALEWQP